MYGSGAYTDANVSVTFEDGISLTCGRFAPVAAPIKPGRSSHRPRRTRRFDVNATTSPRLLIEAFDGLFQVYGSPKCFFDPRRYSASGYHGCATDGCGGGGCWDAQAMRTAPCTGAMAPELALSCALDCPIPEKACDGGYSRATVRDRRRRRSAGRDPRPSKSGSSAAIDRGTFSSAVHSAIPTPPRRRCISILRG